MVESLTAKIAGFASRLTAGDLPHEVTTHVANGLADYAAVTILGRNEPVTRIVRSLSRPENGDGSVRICFTDERRLPVDAALINGCAAHALDYDDIGLSDIQPAHPSAVLAPAILAEAEALGSSGIEILAAYVAGFEVWGELSSREKVPVHLKGWHPTGTFGAVAAAAAISNLRKLDVPTTMNALGISASQASGILANFGSMTKPFHAGRAAQIGIFSVRLAEAGLTASPDAIESRAGFLFATSPGGDVDVMTPVRLGSYWWILNHGLGFKIYPMCYGTHRALDTMIDLAREFDLTPGIIESVSVEVTRNQLANLVHHNPRSGLDARFSMEFAMATAIVARRAGLAETTDEFVQRQDVRELMSKVSFSFLDDLAGQGADRRDGVVIRLADGTILKRKFQFPMGHPKRPVSQDVLRDKFIDCVRDAMSRTEASEFFDTMQGFDRISSLSEIPSIGPGTRLLAG